MRKDDHATLFAVIEVGSPPLPPTPILANKDKNSTRNKFRARELASMTGGASRAYPNDSKTTGGLLSYSCSMVYKP
jgi:hypothetical protein